MNFCEIKKLVLPRYWNGVTPNHRGSLLKLDPYFFDTETCKGKVYTLFFQDDDGKPLVYYGDGINYLAVFFSLVESALKKSGNHVFAAHNLRFDLQVLFWDLLHPLCKVKRAPQHSEFSYLPLKARVKIFWGRPCFASVTINGKTCCLIDTLAFFPMSLSDAIKAIGGQYRKKKKPVGLGDRVLSLDVITNYGLNDVRGGMEILKEILKFLAEYDLNMCVSMPHAASRIFRHKFLTRGYQKPPPMLIVLSMLSYHGGKNTFPDKKVAWYRKVNDIDINSAYPFAMMQLPDFEYGEWVKTNELHPHGIYMVEGVIKSCKWGCLFDSDFKKLGGRIKTVSTSYEILSAQSLDHLEIKKLSGYYFKEAKNKPEKSALRRYVEHFFDLKKKTKNPGKKIIYKMVLNSLYGKFIQRNEDDETDEKTAGAMFDPAVASLITGYTRAQIHGLEHKYNSLHTSTDGIITQEKLDEKDFGDEIGKLSVKGTGDVLIVRNKLYALFNSDNGKLLKFAAHGFLGSLSQLLNLIDKKEKLYTASRMSTWREAWHTLERPGVMRKIKMILHY